MFWLKCNIISLILCIIIATAAKSEANSIPADFEPGKEVPLKFDKEGIECIVYVPTDYNDNCDWPVLFFYHGKGAKLSTERIKIATQGKNFVIVCMEFAPTTSESMNSGQYHSYLKHEIKNLAFVRRWLADKLKIDAKMTVLSGYSRGAWLAADIFNLRPQLAAAAAIIGAGYHDWLVKEERSFAGKYVYVGAGETDQNLGVAKMTIKYFANRDAEVIYEIYAGVGHKFKADSPKLQNWFSDLRKKLQPSAEKTPVSES